MQKARSPGTPSSPEAAGPASTAGSSPGTLDDLALMKPAALGELYRMATIPTVPALNGDLVGRMLAEPVLPGWMAGALRRFAAWRGFPWRGKSLIARDDAGGEGRNLLFADRNPRRWFPFHTFIAPSRAGAFDALQLDYDNPGNPRLIRAIKDELREVAPGLYLGLAYFVWRNEPRLFLYFGLARRR
jgi:hypothetical protein